MLICFPKTNQHAKQINFESLLICLLTFEVKHMTLSEHNVNTSGVWKQQRIILTFSKCFTENRGREACLNKV